MSLDAQDRDVAAAVEGAGRSLDAERRRRLRRAVLDGESSQRVPVRSGQPLSRHQWTPWAAAAALVIAIAATVVIVADRDSTPTMPGPDSSAVPVSPSPTEVPPTDPTATSSAPVPTSAAPPPIMPGEPVAVVPSDPVSRSTLAPLTTVPGVVDTESDDFTIMPAVVLAGDEILVVGASTSGMSDMLVLDAATGQQRRVEQIDVPPGARLLDGVHMSAEGVLYLSYYADNSPHIGAFGRNNGVWTQMESARWDGSSSLVLGRDGIESHRQILLPWLDTTGQQALDPGAPDAIVSIDETDTNGNVHTYDVERRDGNDVRTWTIQVEDDGTMPQFGPPDVWAVGGGAVAVRGSTHPEGGIFHVLLQRNGLGIWFGGTHDNTGGYTPDDTVYAVTADGFLVGYNQGADLHLAWVRATREPVRDESGEIVGWIDRAAEPLWVELPADYAAQPGAPAAIGVAVVYSFAGDPIGFFGPQGFVRGGINDDGTALDPNVQADLIEEAIGGTAWSIAPGVTISSNAPG